MAFLVGFYGRECHAPTRLPSVTLHHCLNDMRYLINKLQVRGRRPRQIKGDRETAELANIMECLHTCTCLALCVCVCVSVLCCVHPV